METLKGRLDAIKYQGDNYWTVATLLTDRGQRTTIVGNLLTVEPGDSLKLSGEWKSHPSFGRQFQFSSFEVLAPSTDEGVIGFLASKLGDVGRNRAIEMVRLFGRDKVFEVIEREPERLTEIAGVTLERAKQMQADYRKVKGMREALVFLKRFRLTDNQTARVMDRYGADACKVLQEDPYQLMDIDGFGFKTVDEIARRVGVDHHGLARAKAGCIYLLQVARDKGNIFVPRGIFRKQVVKELAIAGARVDEAVNLLVEKGSVIIEADRVYATPLYEAEIAIADKLLSLVASNRVAEPTAPAKSPQKKESSHAQ